YPLMIQQQTRSTLFPYTTLFRSPGAGTEKRQPAAQQRRVLHWFELSGEREAGERRNQFQCERPERKRQRATHPLGTTDAREQGRSEEHTSELQSRGHLVCRLLLE